MKERISVLGEKYGRAILRPIATIAVALVIGMLFILPTGFSPLKAYGIIFKGAFGSSVGWLGTLAKATPLLFTGLAAAFASWGGCFNIGIEGQLYMGAMAAALVGHFCGGLPGVILIPLCLIAAMAAAVLWALIPGLLNNKLEINIFIMFFIFNNIASLLTDYLASNPLRGELVGVEATGRIAAQARFFRFSNYSDLNGGLLIALGLVLLFWFVQYKTRFGYECSAIGQNATFGEYIGIRYARRSMLVLIISAMVAGLCGAEQTMGVLGRFYPNFSSDYGFTGISIGMLANDNPIAVAIFAIFFGGLTYGGQQLESNSAISSDLVRVIQAIVIMFISADFIVKKTRAKRRNKAREKQGREGA